MEYKIKRTFLLHPMNLSLRGIKLETRLQLLRPDGGRSSMLSPTVRRPNTFTIPAWVVDRSTWTVHGAGKQVTAVHAQNLHLPPV